MHVVKRMRHRVATIAAAGLLAISGATAINVVAAPPARAASICDQYGTAVVGNYVVQNNRWGTSATQCINTTGNGFGITRQDGSNSTSGGPVSYPSIYLGCHYGNCSPSSPLPAQIAAMGNANSSISYAYIDSGTWDAAYDIWLNATTDVSGVQDTEIMIWLNHRGSVQPVGSATGSAGLAGHSWTVWTGNNGSNNVVSYVAGSAISSLSFNVRDFITDTLNRGSQYGSTSWYLTSVQAGFEPWAGGVGLAVSSFSASIGGGGGGGGGGGAAACTTTASVQSQWNNGYVMQMTVRNTGTTTLNGWRSTATMPSGHTYVGSWPVAATVSGQNVTEHSTTSLAPGQTASWGWQAGRPNGNTQLPTSFTCASP